jgi:hypothetical protein
MAEVKYLDKTGLGTVWSKVKGIVTPKADKVSGATNGHLAGLNSSGNLTDSGLAATNIAQKDGSYSGMTVGAAEDLVSAESVASEFTSRITGGSTAVGKGGTALVDKIKGRTLVMNQQVTNGNFTVAENWTNLSSVSNNIGYFTFSAQLQYGAQNEPIISGHKYYMRATCLRDNVNVSLRASGANFITINFTAAGTLSAVGMSPSDGLANLRIIELRTQNFEPIGITGIVIIDLTLMFGSGSELTAAEMDALYPDYINTARTGYLINNAASGVETVGFNQWDEEVEEGSFDQYGVPVSGGARLRAKNFIEVFPNTDYYVCMTGTHTTQERVARVVWYDAAKNVVLVTDNAYLQYGVTSPANAKFAKFHIGQAYGTAYKGDICFSLSDTSRNGTYEPYWRSELELGLGDIKVKSHNLWDEVWEEGTIDIDTGQNITGTAIRSVNYIPVSPGGTYYHKGTAGIREYDAQKNYLGRQSQLTDVAFTVSNNCSYIRIISAGVTTYSNNICINLSDPAFNGRYEPYGEGGVITITGGLKSAGTKYDEISGNKLVKRIESVDMGTPAWSYLDEYTVFYADIAGMPSVYTTNMLCVKYTAKGVIYTSLEDKEMSNRSGYNRLYVKDSAYTDAATFKAAMSGVPLYYELAQPIEYELADAFPTAMRNDPYGTERRLPEDTAAIVTAPFRADITYSTNIKEAVQSLPQNYINVNSMQDFLAELGTLMGGTWTMRPADGKFDFTFTPNPSNE